MLFVLREQEALWSEDFFAFNRTAVNAGRFLKCKLFFFKAGPSLLSTAQLSTQVVNAGSTAGCKAVKQ
jgi:hypothetical protein